MPLLLTPFAPFYAYISCVFIMVGLSAYISREYRVILSLTLIFNIALICASRLYFNIAQDYDDDFSRYYQNYLDVFDGIDGAFRIWDKWEIGLPLFYKLLSLFKVRFSPQMVLFATAFSVAVLLYLWLEIFILKYIPRQSRAALIAFALFVDIFLQSLGLTRQCFSSVFILYCIASRDMRLKVLFGILAICFHVSAIFVILCIFVGKRFPKASLFALLIFVIVFAQNASGINTSLHEFANFLKDYLPNKIYVYFRAYIDAGGWNLWTIIYMPIMQIILMLCIIFSSYILAPKDAILHRYRAVITIAFVVFATHIAPGRIAFLATSLMFYFLAFLAFRRFYKLTLLFFFPYFLKRIYTLYFPNYELDHIGSIFFSFDSLGIVPFYYFLGV